MGKLDVMEAGMSVSLDEVLARLPSEEQQAVRVRTAELVAREMSLRDLRKALGKTQVAMADHLGIKQENVSRIEQRSDMLLSTLNSYLRGMGGRLRLIAEFEGRPPVELTGLADVATTAVPAGLTSAATRLSRRKGSALLPPLQS